MKPAEFALLTHRVTEVPSVEDAAEMRSRMLPVIASAHAGGRPLACCWLRAKARGKVAVLVGGLRAGPGGSTAFPAGARLAALRPDQVSDAGDRMSCWQPAELAVDATEPADGQDVGPALDDLFALLSDRPMAVFVVAEPLTRPQIEPRLEELSTTVDDLEPRRDGRGSERVRLARAEAELTYLERWSSWGLWRIRVWTAGPTTADCAAVAAMIGGGADVTSRTMRVRPGDGAERDEGGLRWGGDCVAGADAVVALARPPARELPGIVMATVPVFDVTPELSGEFAVGDVLDATGRPTLPFAVAGDSVNRHVFVTGATGSGKSHTVRTLLAQLTRAGVPWLVVEPAKSEYAAMAGRVAPVEVLVIRPGDPDAVPGSVNPLEPSAITVGGRVERFPLQTHLDLVRALFIASFQAQDPFPQLLASALTRSYEHLGWNLVLGRPTDGRPTPRWPDLADLQRQALRVVDEVGYGREVRENVRGFVQVRIAGLLTGTPGRFFRGGHPIDLERLLGANVVFEIEDLGDDNDKAFFIGCVLIRLFEVLRLRERHGVLKPGLAHVTVVEEAHRLLRAAADGPAAAQAVGMFADLFAEVRAYGEGIVVAEQIPTKLIADVIKNSAVKLVHRLPAKDDRDFVGATMNLDEEQSGHVVALRPGIAVAHTDGMDRPILVAVDRAGHRREGRAKSVARIPVGRRHPACPPGCAARPCTLADIVRADSLPRSAWIGLWAEVAVLAYLVGGDLGTPSDEWISHLRGQDQDRVACAVGSATQAAVARRDRHLRRWYPPDDLATEVGTVLRGQVSRPSAFGVPELRWRIGRYRWAEVLRAIDDGDDEPPRVAEWAALGLHVSGVDSAERHENVLRQAHHDRVPDREAFGGEPMVIDELTASIIDEPRPDLRLLWSLRLLGVELTWPATVLEKCWRDEQ